MKRQLWTIGHSTHSLEDFVALLSSFQISTLIDIRSLPGSRKFPQFDKEALGISMPSIGIQYFHFLDLGGRRKPVKDSKNTAWKLASFRGFADYMDTAPFQKSVQGLMRIATMQRTVIMCAEVLWWRCHRSLIADYLKVRGWDVYHITGQGKTQEHPYTRPARIINNQLSYEENADC